MVSAQEGRNSVLIEISRDYADIAVKRIEEDGGMYVSVSVEDGSLAKPQ